MGSKSAFFGRKKQHAAFVFLAPPFSALLYPHSRFLRKVRKHVLKHKFAYAGEGLGQRDKCLRLFYLSHEKNAFINPARRVQCSIYTLQCTQSWTATFSPSWAKHEHSVGCESDKKREKLRFRVRRWQELKSSKKCSKMSTKVLKNQKIMCFFMFFTGFRPSCI